jgi:hypothetical protein
MQVPDRVVQPAYPLPPLPEPEEHLLSDVLGFLPAPGDRKQSLVETALLGAKQLLERRRRTAHSKVLMDAELVR